MPLREAGFGREVRRALDARRRWLIEQGLGHEEEDRIIYRSNLLAILRRRELARVAAQLSEELGLKYVELREGQEISGIYRCHVDLLSGRYTLLQGAAHFALAPWRPAIQQFIGKELAGIGRRDCGKLLTIGVGWRQF